MKSITYFIGIFALILTLSSCTADEIEPVNASKITAIVQPNNTINLTTEANIEIPIQFPRPN